MIDSEFLDILACPVCDERPALRLEGERLVCTKCGRNYPILEGIPQLTPEDGTLDPVRTEETHG